MFMGEAEREGGPVVVGGLDVSVMLKESWKAVGEKRKEKKIEGPR